MIGVYKITNTKNGKVYIGQSVDVNKRFKQHKNKLRKNDHENYLLQDDWNTYGEDCFVFEILEKCRSVYLNEIERREIKNHNSNDSKFGYNLSAGSGRDITPPSWYPDWYAKRLASPISENSFFKNDVGEIEYNAVCSDCSRNCKQSFRADVLICPKLANR